VADNGIGIAPEDQARVFDRFFRGDNTLILATPGTGLGLSIAKQLVEMHRGTISVTSDGVEGHGSTFSVTLPVAPAAPAVVEAAPTAPPKKKGARRRTPARDASPK
jgi:two-component system sensor histidine kinase SenX3